MTPVFSLDAHRTAFDKGVITIEYLRYVLTDPAEMAHAAPTITRNLIETMTTPPDGPPPFVDEATVLAEIREQLRAN